MSIENETSQTQQSEDTGEKLTVAENVIVTAKILGGFALLGLTLWALDFWV
jgi:hypothetical protein